MFYLVYIYLYLYIHINWFKLGITILYNTHVVFYVLLVFGLCHGWCGRHRWQLQLSSSAKKVVAVTVLAAFAECHVIFLCN